MKLFVKTQENMSCRDSCAIADLDNDTVIITGGSWMNTNQIVSVYNEEGHVGNLENLNPGRHHHACTSYTSNGSKVSVMQGHSFEKYGLMGLLCDSKTGRKLLLGKKPS